MVAYPEATEDRATAAMIVDIDPVKLSRKDRGDSGPAEQYVNDRPYTANSFVSVAIAEAFGTAMSGKCDNRPEVAATAIPLEIKIPVLKAAGGADFINRLFAPLGYAIECTAIPLDPKFPEWGVNHYFEVTLKGEVLLRDALRHLYILLPVLDAQKHYYMDANEVSKMVAKGEGWLAEHPEKKAIVRAFLGKKTSLVTAALDQLATIDADVAEPESMESEELSAEIIETPKSKRQSLHTQRHQRITDLIKELSPKSVVDLGCGEGKLIRQLIPIQGIERILGLEVSYRTLETAIRRLNLEEGGQRYRNRVELIHGSLMYRDERIANFDVATVVEVIEHMDEGRLVAFERVLFKYARPKVALITTPNREYNVLYNDVDMRHEDHRFEWTRQEFEDWANRVAAAYGYAVRFEGIGEADPVHGSPSQLGVFTR
jgi:3' terminal RNA ribose 2'-O-methyltransferase Hen1